MANRDYIVFDFETGSRNPHKTQPTQIAALALDGRNLSMKGTFNSEIRPILSDDAALAAGLDPIEDGALKVTGKNREDLAKAPTLKSVWKKFCTFVRLVKSILWLFSGTQPSYVTSVVVVVSIIVVVVDVGIFDVVVVSIKSVATSSSCELQEIKIKTIIANIKNWIFLTNKMIKHWI